MRSLPVSPNESTILQQGYLSRHKNVVTGEYSLGNVIYYARSQRFAFAFVKDKINHSFISLKKKLAKKADYGSNPFTFLASFI
jgi:hypothetical protein